LQLGVLDILFCRRFRARWMALHTIANIVVVATTIFDVMNAADNPILSCVGKGQSDVPTNMIVALH